MQNQERREGWSSVVAIEVVVNLKGVNEFEYMMRSFIANLAFGSGN